MRLFVGIPLEHAVVDELSAISTKLRSDDDGLRWAAPESWHITLQFLGSTSETKYGCVTKRLREVRAMGVPVKLEDLGFFERSGVFFADVGLTPELVALQQLVVTADAKCGFEAEKRPYHPHITLARAKGAGQGHGLGQLKGKVKQKLVFTEFVAGEFVLYESMLERTGARYEIRERFRLD
jgi:RNA 2',3'-cyclic 3'-phosphodiesterase